MALSGRFGQRVGQAAVLMALSSVIVAGCSGAQAGTVDPAPSPSPSAEAFSLAGEWSATGPALDSGTRLLFGTPSPSFEIVAPCGSWNGTWAAAESGATVLTIGMVDGACAPEVEGTRQIEPDWVAVVRSAVPVSEGAELRDAEGRVVATLTRVGIAPANPPTPLLTPVPDAAPVTQQDLVGVWAASDGRVLELRADGRALPQDCGWRAKGRWTVTDTSTLIHAGPGSRPGAWCEQESLVLDPAGAGAYSVGLRAGDLVIMDSEGSEAILTRTDT